MNPLADLKPLHLPEAPSFLPPAFGWWLALLLLFLTLGSLIFWFIKKRRQNRYRKIALAELEKLWQNHKTMEAELWLQQCSQLLKRVALTTSLKSEAQNLYAEQWGEFLIRTLPDRKQQGNQKSQQVFSKIYQKQNLSAADLLNLYQFSKVWIQSHQC